MQSKNRISTLSRLGLVVLFAGCVFAVTSTSQAERQLQASGSTESASSRTSRFGCHAAQPGGRLNENSASTVSSQCEKILFEQREELSDYREIYSMNQDGSDKVRLLPQGMKGESPKVSRDGSQVLFLSPVIGASFLRDKIYVVNTDGSGLHQVTTFDYAEKASLSPDGTKILFLLRNDNNEFTQIFTVNVDGSELTALTPADTSFYDDPIFSPDGSKIVFSRDVFFNDDYLSTELFSMNLDGSNVTELTTRFHTGNHQPEFSPDGSKIIFISESLDDNLDTVSYSLDIMNADGSGRASLMQTSNPSEQIYSPHFNPQGNMIVYGYTLSEMGTQRIADVYSINADGSNNVNLTSNQNTFGDYAPVFDLDGAHILFTSHRDSSSALELRYHVFSMNLDGTNVTNLTGLGVGEEGPVAAFFDPDQDGVSSGCDNCPANANSNQRDTDADGLGDTCDPDDDNDGLIDESDNCPVNANPNQLDTDGDGQGNACDVDDDNDGVNDSFDNCPLTSNGYRFAFSAARIVGNPEIYTMNLNGTDLRRITNNSQNDLLPNINLAGNRIVFASNRTGDYEIYSVNSAGLDLQRLTNNSASIDTSPIFNQDGSRIAFASGVSPVREIFVMNADGSNRTQVTFVTGTTRFSDNPSFNNDGTRIVFDSQRGSTPNLTHDIYSINPDGTGETRLTTTAGQDSDPSYSRDGSKIVFISKRDNVDGEIYVMNADGSNQTRVTNSTEREAEPAFTPDGSRIIFRAATAGQLYTINVDGTDPAPVTGSTATDSTPSFAAQPDSDGDGIGDACDACNAGNQTDSDLDGLPDACDNCPQTPNQDQADHDGDNVGDVCDPDDDNDSVPDVSDNCPLVPNPSQNNNDGDSLGDACDADDDNDGVFDVNDNCQFVANPDQGDNDGDEIGDECDPDDDNDGVLDVTDNCPLVENSNQLDTDQDSIGDECDPDDDNDGVPDEADNCSLVANPGQGDADNDGIGDVCDDINDGIETATGTNVVAQISNASVTFANVTTAGTTTFTPITADSSSVPNGYSLCQTCPAFDITTTAQYSPPVTVCIGVPADVNEPTYLTMKLLHGEGGVFVDRTTGHVTDEAGQRFVCGVVQSLSPFALASSAGPTAASASISGTVTGIGGAPVAGAVINLSGAQSRKTITDADGNYRFENVESNGFYTVTPSRLNFHFAPDSRTFSVLANITDATFTATPDAVAIGNVIDTPEYFVRQHYLDFLGREPDESGFNFWSNQILECSAGAGCLERRRVNVSAAYFLSIEFQETGGLVDRLYRTSYGRHSLYAEFMPDSATVARGVVVGRAGWQQQLETNKQAFIDAWVQRQTFRAVYDGLSNEGYVEQLIAHTGVNYSLGERQALVTGLTNATLTRAAVLRRIAENQTFVHAEFNDAFVMMQYFGYLRRDPDEAGFQFWLHKLNEFNGNFEQAEMVKAFIVSGEYRTRFASR